MQDTSKDLMVGAGNQKIEAYRALYERSVRDPEGFWSEMADHLDWYEKWVKVLEYDFKKPEINWFKGGKLNVSYNCLDRHLHTWRSNKAALIWQGYSEENRVFTYQQLHYHVCKFANVLKKFGVRKGDRVSLYLPNIPELLISMLACARIGAIHSAVFIEFGQKILADRINDSGSKLLITADGCHREGQLIQSKAVADEALKDCPGVERVIIVKRLEMKTPFTEERDLWWHEEMGREDIIPRCEPAVMDAEDALFLLYTSGSKGHPNGIIHTTAGYLLFASKTLEWSFNLNDEDVFLSTEDTSGVIGHSYGVYGPLTLGATTLILEDSPNNQSLARFWEMVEKYKVTALLTDPAAVRALMQGGEEWGKRREISSLRLLGTAGESMNREAWNGWHLHPGLERCPMLDTWSQPETGGFLIYSLLTDPFKTESVLLPFPGIAPKVLTENGSECDVDEVGSFVMANPWPAILRGFWNDPDHNRFKESHFQSFPGYYFTGEGAKKDSDGYFRMMGRIDEAIQVAGNRIGVAEIESALASHPSVAERAAIHVPHHERGNKTYAFVTLKTGIQNSEALRQELVAHTKKLIGPAAAPDQIHFSEVLPKTKNRAIMRRMLGKVAEEKIEELGTILFFHPGHTWLKQEKSDEVRIGIDSFLAKMIGRLRMIVLPQSGRRFDQGDALCSVIREEGGLDVVFPVGGSILSVNERLKERPELVTKDPLGEGYLVTVRPENFQRDRRHLFFGEVAVSWYQREWERFKAAVVSELTVDQKGLGITMQDGEIGLGHIERLINTERYIQLLNAFLRKGEREPSDIK